MDLNLHENCISLRYINKHVTTHMLDSYLDINSRVSKSSKMKYIKFNYYGFVTNISNSSYDALDMLATIAYLNILGLEKRHVVGQS